jgi:hypothetical protein
MKMPAMMAADDAGGEAMANEAAPAAAPKAKPSRAMAPGQHVADIKKRAKSMLGRGLISQKQHDSLIGKADKVSKALGAELLPQE